MQLLTVLSYFQESSWHRTNYSSSDKKKNKREKGYSEYNACKIIHSQNNHKKISILYLNVIVEHFFEHFQPFSTRKCFSVNVFIHIQFISMLFETHLYNAFVLQQKHIENDSVGKNIYKYKRIKEKEIFKDFSHLQTPLTKLSNNPKVLRNHHKA